MVCPCKKIGGRRRQLCPSLPRQPNSSLNFIPEIFMSKQLIVRLVSSAVFAGTVLIAASGCAQKVVQHAPPPPTVTVERVEQQPVIEWEEFTGRTAAIENVDVRPRVTGHIEAVKFRS